MTSFWMKQFVSRRHLISFVTLPFGWGEKFLTSSNPSTAIDRQTDNSQQRERIATLTKGLSFIKKAMLAFCVLQHYIGLVVSITKYFWTKHIYSHFMRKGKNAWLNIWLCLPYNEWISWFKLCKGFELWKKYLRCIAKCQC